MTLVSAPARAARPVTGIVSVASLGTEDALRDLGVVDGEGLSVQEVALRRAQWGPNAVSSHRARLLPVLWHQLRSPLLGLLLTAVVASYFVGERSAALIIGVIVALSVGLGFVNEYRAEKAAEALHDQIHHETVVIRDGKPSMVDVTGLVPGDVVELHLGDIVPADVRLLEVTGLECDESVLTGESLPVDKTTDPVPAGTADPGRAAVLPADVAALDDAALASAITATTVFARVSPEDKARIVRVQRRSGGGVAFLGDGVNDALALHAADVGISVDSATDVAKDAADVILLEKDLDVLADGVTEGRRIFANTIKYVLMGTSSNFGNMFSAAGASLFLSFLPMLPFQILLNNLLYDSSQLAIPTDNVDEEQLRQPSHWDIGFIRRFMIFFGQLSSVFDFLTFGVMLWVFHAGARSRPPQLAVHRLRTLLSTSTPTGWLVASPR
jgi:magnesium-transporting ATPase (P-type)